MKFGKIHRQTVETRMPQWRDHCVDYKALKKAIKKQMAAGVQGKSWLKHQRAISPAILLTRTPPSLTLQDERRRRSRRPSHNFWTLTSRG